ncbi:MAG TPA: DUF1802 family protein, partial [Allocoleopsis sp.]
MTSISTQTPALKEWDVAVNALAQGRTILLLRKGGIQEQAFSVAQSQFWLYPTYEHQKPHLLKAEYASQVSPVEPGWHPETVPIQAWATVTHAFQVSEAAVLSELLPFHIWTEEFITERLKWKPRLPLSLLLLRVFRLAESQPIPYRSEYGGCKSWIDLHVPLALEQAVPVLPEADYWQQV